MTEAEPEFTALGERALSGHYPGAREAVYELAAITTAQSTDVLARLADAAPENVRIDIAEALGTTAPIETARAALLARLIADASPMVRVASAESIGKAGASCFLDTLVNLVHADTDWLVRATAIESIVQLRARDAVGALAAALDDESDIVQAYAAMGIGIIGTTEHLSILSARLDKASDRVKAEVFAALYRLGSAEGLRRLLALRPHDETMAIVMMNVLEDLVSRERPPTLTTDVADVRLAVDAIAASYPIVESTAKHVRDTLSGLSA
jgi:HEAT repeat protein